MIVNGLRNGLHFKLGYYSCSTKLNNVVEVCVKENLKFPSEKLNFFKVTFLLSYHAYQLVMVGSFRASMEYISCCSNGNHDISVSTG